MDILIDTFVIVILWLVKVSKVTYIIIIAMYVLKAASWLMMQRYGIISHVVS